MQAIFQQIITQAADFQSVLRSASIIASTDVHLLISGASGTGKTLLAETIHQASPRAENSLHTLNCATLHNPESEASFFAQLAEAHGSTLILDEVAELPALLQAHLLRLLESGDYLQPGASQPTQAEVRIIALTQADLYQAVQQGKFRADLFYRLNIVPLHLLSLRERHGDTSLLLEHFNQQLAAQYQLPAPRYNKETRKYLRQYDWPGNVRELRNLCERLLILCSGQELSPAQLPAEIRPAPSSNEAKAFVLPEIGLKLDDLEADLIRQALDQANGNRSRAARLLGLTRDTLLYRMKKYAL